MQTNPTGLSGEILQDAQKRIDNCRKTHITLCIAGPDGICLPANTPVHLKQTQHAFLLGSNIFPLFWEKEPAKSKDYAAHFTALWNYATLPFYWSTYEREKGAPQHDAANRVSAWCHAHNIQPKGHPLVWNDADPAWLDVPPLRAVEMLLERVFPIVSLFKGKIDIWDVVNETTVWNAFWFLEKAPVLTEGIRQMGVEQYTRMAFECARAANPDALLLINDTFAGVTDHPKVKTDRKYDRDVIAKLVDASGKPLYDAIGIQSHQHQRTWTPEEIWRVCERFAVFDMPLHFTENTILSGWHYQDDLSEKPQDSWPSTPEGEEKQAQEVEAFYRTVFSYPAVHAVTWWDFDDHQWLGAPGGLIRDDMTPKPAYSVLKKLFHDEWYTHINTYTNENSEVHFHGYYGQYHITVPKESEPSWTATFSLEPSAPSIQCIGLSPEP